MCGAAAFCEAAHPVKPGHSVGFCLSSIVGPRAARSAGALEVPLSLLYALSGDERCSSAQWGIRKSGGAN